MSTNWNMYKSITWFQDSHTIEVPSKLDSLGKSQNKVLGFASDWPFRSSVIQYKNNNMFPFVQYIENEESFNDSNKVDYFLHLDQPLANAGYFPDSKTIPVFHRDTIMNFEEERILLFENKYNANLPKYKKPTPY